MIMETQEPVLPKSAKLETTKLSSDPSSKSILAVVRRCRQEAEQFTAELLALEESDANPKEMDAMLSNILSRFFTRKMKHIRNFDDIPMSTVNEIAKAVVSKHKTFKLTEPAKEMISIYDNSQSRNDSVERSGSLKRAEPPEVKSNVPKKVCPEKEEKKNEESINNAEINDFNVKEGNTAQQSSEILPTVSLDDWMHN